MLRKEIIGMMIAIAILSFPSVDGQVKDETIVMSCNDGEIMIRYSPVFEIGEEWPVYLEWNDCDNLAFVVIMSETAMGNESRSIALTNDGGEDGIVFQRYTFYEEDFNVLVTFLLLDEEGNNVKESKEIYIDVNKTMPNDLRNLWIAMSLFWIGIGSYMGFMHKRNNKINRDLKTLLEVKKGHEEKD